VRSRIRRDNHSCEAKPAMKMGTSRAMQYPNRSSRRAGSGLLRTRLSGDIRCPWFVLGMPRKNDPVMWLHFVKSSSRRWFAFRTRTSIGASVKFMHSASLTYRLAQCRGDDSTLRRLRQFSATTMRDSSVISEHCETFSPCNNKQLCAMALNPPSRKST